MVSFTPQSLYHVERYHSVRGREGTRIRTDAVVKIYLCRLCIAVLPFVDTLQPRHALEAVSVILTFPL
jgi:hypothetical protein